MDELVYQKGTLHIEHRSGEKPANITIDGQAWTPVWTKDRSEDFSSFSSPLAPFSGTVVVKKIKGRPNVDVTQKPSKENDYTLVIRVNDGASGKADVELQVHW